MVIHACELSLHYCRIGEDSPRIPIRVYLTNQSGYYLDITMYKEVSDEASGHVRSLLKYNASLVILSTVNMGKGEIYMYTYVGVDCINRALSGCPQVMFQAYGNKQGPLHGMLMSTPYMTKDHLQLKRSSAQKMGTTYVYDFPEMFRNVRAPATLSF